MKSFVFSVYCDVGLRCAERAGGIYQLDKNMTYLSSLTASQGMVTWMYSAVLAARCPSDYCSNPDCVTDVFGVSTSVFGGLRNGQWRLYECDDLHLQLSPGVLALQWVTRTVHQPQLTFYLIFGQVSAAEHLAASPRPRKVVISSWEPREKESVISFLLGAERRHQTHQWQAKDIFYLIHQDSSKSKDID